jgi:hypothetical protein
MSALTASIIEIALTFAVTIFFAAIAIERETLISSALATVTSFTCGMFVFLLDPLGFGQYVCWIFFLMGAVFAFQLIYKMMLWINDRGNSRFEVAPI